jgi:hypothetical protein
MKKIYKLIFISLAIASLAGAIFAYYLWNKPHRNPADEDGIALTSVEIYESYENNEKKSDSLYLNKTLQITGIVENKIVKEDGSKLITLTGGEMALGGVLVSFQPSDTSKINTIEKGANITVKGICSGKLDDVVINEAVFILEN